MELSEVEEVVEEIRGYNGLELWDSEGDPGLPISDEVIEKAIGMVWEIYTYSYNLGKDIEMTASPFFDDDLYLDIDCGERYIMIHVTATGRMGALVLGYHRDLKDENYIKPEHHYLEDHQIMIRAKEFLFS